MPKTITGWLAVGAIGAVLHGGDARAEFPDAHEAPLAGWTGPVFKLSQAYPASKPTNQPKPWKTVDFRTKPQEYLKAVLDYCLEGNVATDWAGATNPVRKWFHAPWLHSGVKGREFMRGLTRERSARRVRLHPNQTEVLGAYAVGLYNPAGGWTIGRVWADPTNPDPSKARFPDGTVAVKLLFVEVPEKREGNGNLPPAQRLDAQVPYLANGFEWDAFVSADGNFGTSARKKGRVRLIQVDVAVKDDRAAGTSGWVFGTYNYSASAPGATPWDRLLPIGLMWGNDPSLTPQRYRTGSRPAQSRVLAANVMANAATDWKGVGWLERLNGPIDNPASACLSCHMTAEWPVVSPMFMGSLPWSVVSDPNETIDPEAVTQKMRWFRNIKAHPFDAGSVSLDYSLQLRDGIENWHRAEGDNR